MCQQILLNGSYCICAVCARRDNLAELLCAEIAGSEHAREICLSVFPGHYVAALVCFKLLCEKLVGRLNPDSHEYA